MLDGSGSEAEHEEVEGDNSRPRSPSVPKTPRAASDEEEGDQKKLKNTLNDDDLPPGTIYLLVSSLIFILELQFDDADTEEQIEWKMHARSLYVKGLYIPPSQRQSTDGASSSSTSSSSSSSSSSVTPPPEPASNKEEQATSEKAFVPSRKPSKSTPPSAKIVRDKALFSGKNKRKELDSPVPPITAFFPPSSSSSSKSSTTSEPEGKKEKPVFDPSMHPSTGGKRPRFSPKSSSEIPTEMKYEVYEDGDQPIVSNESEEGQEEVIPDSQPQPNSMENLSAEESPDNGNF